MVEFIPQESVNQKSYEIIGIIRDYFENPDWIDDLQLTKARIGHIYLTIRNGKTTYDHARNDTIGYTPRDVSIIRIIGENSYEIIPFYPSRYSGYNCIDTKYVAILSNSIDFPVISLLDEDVEVIQRWLRFYDTTTTITSKDGFEITFRFQSLLANCSIDVEGMSCSLLSFKHREFDSNIMYPLIVGEKYEIVNDQCESVEDIEEFLHYLGLNTSIRGTFKKSSKKSSLLGEESVYIHYRKKYAFYGTKLRNIQYADHCLVVDHGDFQAKFPFKRYLIDTIETLGTHFISCDVWTFGTFLAIFTDPPKAMAYYETFPTEEEKRKELDEKYG